MKRIITALIIGSLLACPILNAAPFIYGTNVAERGVWNLTKIDVGSSSFVSQKVIDDETSSIQITPDNQYIYMAFGFSTPYFPTIQVFNTFTQTLSSFALDTHNQMIAITPDGAYGYTTTLSNRLSAFQIPSNIAHPNIINPLPNIINSNGIAIAPDQQYLYITDAGSNTVQIVNISTPLSPTIPSPASFTVGTAGTRLADIAITSDGTTAYVVSSNDNRVYQVTGLPSSPTAGISISVSNGIGGSAIPIVLTSDNDTAYVGRKALSVSSLGSLVIIDNLTTSPVTTFITSPFFSVPGLAISKDNKYVAAANGNGVGIITTADNSFVIVTATTYNNVAITANPNPPSNVQGCAMPLLNDFTNVLTWDPPAPGPVVPFQYNIYSDAALTTLLGSVPAAGPLTFQIFSLDPTQTYTYYIVTADQLGDQSTPVVITVAPYDLCYPAILPPSSIEGCFIQNYDGTITNFISWTPPASGPMPTEYQIFYDAGLTQLVATVPGYVLSYEDPGLAPGTYTYYVISVDAYGDVSAPISITITDPCYPYPQIQPDPPSNVIGTLRCNIFLDRNERILNICWTASPSADVVSYNIYNGSTIVANIVATKPLCFVTALGRCDNGQNFSMTAVNTNGVESVHLPVIIM